MRGGAFIIWSGVLAYLSLTPSVKAPAGLQIWDKFSHLVAYAVLALLLIGAVAAWRRLSVRLLSATWAACAAYGLLLEALQGLMGIGRQWEAGDLLANALGSLVVCVISRHILLQQSPT